MRIYRWLVGLAVAITLSTMAAAQSLSENIMRDCIVFAA